MLKYNWIKGFPIPFPTTVWSLFSLLRLTRRNEETGELSTDFLEWADEEN